MNPRPAVLLALLTAVLTPSPGQVTEGFKRKFDEAERQIVRLPPTAFTALPRNLVQDLQRRGCTIPQGFLTKKPHNVIRGRFAKPGQTDWAVLCSVKAVSSILVYWNGSEQNPSAIAPVEDRHYLQTISADGIGFSRAITPVGREFIMRHYRAYGGPKPPPIDHQGIDDEYLEKASVTWYFYRGKWLGLTGAD